VTFVMKVLVYGTLTVCIIGGRVGRRLAVAVAAPVLGSDPAVVSHVLDALMEQQLAISLVILSVGMLLLELGYLVGVQTLRDIALGRYHRSRTEERFFLFVDIAGSTSLAERIGAEAVHRFLGEVFRLASDPIDEHDGDVYQYVGDEVVITWTVDKGRDQARPLACLGGSRRAIVYHGDVMNTTSRLEQATRDLERQFLASEDALARLEDLDGFVLDDLGPKPLRGRAATVRVYAVTTHRGRGSLS
jgi:adenylate cyclase